MKRAILTVTDKTDLDLFAKNLISIFPDLEIIASGGTSSCLKEAGIAHTPLSTYTHFPECFDGRVKTLHPVILGGILLRRGIDDREAEHLQIAPIDLVVCNLYTFNVDAQQVDTNHIDIGGSALIRAACKNYSSVAVVVDPADYSALVEEWIALKDLSMDTRYRLAAKAMRLCAQYDQKIADAFEASAPFVHSVRLESQRQLSYGENPDQEGWVYNLPGQEGITSAQVMGGKALSYNNYEDASQGFFAMQRLDLASPTSAIIKHGGLCGLATGKHLLEAFEKAWEGDAKSAFGSIVALSHEVGEEFCEALQDRFIELILAPDFSTAFLNWAAQSKPSLRLLKVCYHTNQPYLYRGIAGGLLVQTRQKKISQSLFQPLNENKRGIATLKNPQLNQAGLFDFALAAVQSVKSNAIVIAWEYEPSLYQLIGIGGGQPNRVDSLQKLALPKAIEYLSSQQGKEHVESILSQCVLASDGFFPFADSIQVATDAGIRYFLQPGGSIRDADVIQAANLKSACMIFTGQRYFSH
jgi:phosphoribosylaminoimidazolecarboxamide formyltransferase / IMP cyclohydrolase